MNKIIGKINALILSALMIVSGTAAVTGVFNTNRLTAVAADDTIILRVCNWEEYIDTGDWSDDDIIDLESGSIKGENSIITDFENWYYENYGKKVKVQYSCLGTNEELYNMLTLGDDYDVICPSEYMIMKLMAEDSLSHFQMISMIHRLLIITILRVYLHLSRKHLTRIRLMVSHGAAMLQDICGV